MSVSPSNVASFLKELVSAGAVWQPYQDGDPVQVLSGVSYADDSPYQSVDLFFPADYISPMIFDDTEEKDDGKEDEVKDDEKKDEVKDDEKEDKAKDEKDEIEEVKDETENTVAVAEAVVDEKSSSIVSSQNSPVEERPVYVFIHGGGWSRGGKDNRFYGAPSMCKNMAASYGAISVSIGYRLGNYPDFMNDAAHGIKWVQDNIPNFGGDVQQVFLSGHSAGAHISSLLMLRFDRFLAPLEIRRDFFRGIALLSGVYDLFCPMKKSLVDAKNKAFVVGYVLPAFGYDEQLRRDASPLLLLHPEKDTSLLGTGPLALLQRIASKSDILKRFSSLPSDTSDSSPPLSSTPEDNVDNDENGDGDDDDDARQKGEEKDSENEENKDGGDESVSEKDDIIDADAERQESSPADESPIRLDLPPTLLLNAWFDMGLEENGKLMTEAMKKHGIDAKHVTIPTTEHASICWSQTTIEVVSDFFKNTTTTTAAKSSEEKEEEETPKICEVEETQP